ncbi:hypothetical protein PENARI_c013G11237 [Penicillium arizonense]|uniref:Uncharacterized protein n=1 Tax=Penicillium arizonense TaxID=1835702 RepID=A0A1F5LEE1_PENAI|nr:hypothetical protein PENARI_c013G11237 [Penicillium arizonense]OGE51467.1 hypothetical protein PENARI_c013G11237 [Penicillium arizonense]
MGAAIGLDEALTTGNYGPVMMQISDAGPLASLLRRDQEDIPDRSVKLNS